MKIDELDIEKFDDVYDQLIQLQYENTCIHFPKKDININKHVKPDIDSIKEYMKEKKAFIFIAIENNEVLGFLWCYPRMFLDEKRIFINSLIIKSEYRGRHIGTMLMKKAEEKAKQLNCDSIYVSSASFNENALKFYRAQKYEDERVQLVKQLKRKEK